LNDALRRYDDVERRIEDISAKSGYGSDLIYDNAVPVYARNAEQLETAYIRTCPTWRIAMLAAWWRLG
jgi:hypothetical protein